MELSKFLSLCGILFGLFAAIFLSKVLLMNPEQILRGTYHYSTIGWPSVAIISDKAAQKVDTLASIILVLFALVLQVCALFAGDEMVLELSRLKAVTFAILIAAIIAYAIHLISLGAKKGFEVEIKRVAARDYVESTFETRSCPLYSDIQAIADQYFGFKKLPQEENQDFVQRFAAFLKFDLPGDADFSKFR